MMHGNLGFGQLAQTRAHSCDRLLLEIQQGAQSRRICAERTGMDSGQALAKVTGNLSIAGFLRWLLEGEWI